MTISSNPFHSPETGEMTPEKAEYLRQKVRVGEFRCQYCGRMQGMADLKPGSSYETKCPRCKKMIRIEAI